MKHIRKDWFGFFAPRFALLVLALGLVLRIILHFHPVTLVDWSFGQTLRILGLGLLNDLAFAAIALVPAFLFYSFLTDRKYDRPLCWIILGVLAALTCYVVFFNDITDEYGSAAPLAANLLLILLTLSFALKLFIPRLSHPWRRACIWAVMLLYTTAAVGIAFSEIVFWSEFGVRFNFIAVDYLVYTHEVIGNIVESYPMVPLVGAMLLGGWLVCRLLARGSDLREAGIAGAGRWLAQLALLAALAAGGALWLHHGYRGISFPSLYATQISQNGCWDFLEAFTGNKLEYSQFYELLPDAEAEALRQRLTGQDASGVARIENEGPELRKNIVLITVESLSADFLAHFGNTEGLTPNLDRLAGEGLWFTRLFATGNRTVRGLEAVSLSLPPSAGESLVKRPDNAGFFSLGSLLRERGYAVQFLYGGDSYFDNMGEFFRGNGYDVVDKKDFGRDEITFDNIWGTCDEDSYAVALRTFDADHAAGKPFLGHIMTISNHRPYTYPDGRITYDGNPMSREAAVKYTDYALGKFLEEAARKPWFSETVFVILADHCASSAGKTSLPLDCYHIPALIWSPGFIAPAEVGKVCSQIDLVPTLLQLLNFSYDSAFYGRDILAPDFRERAFMATYQDLGYYADGILTVLSPVRQVRQFAVTEAPDGRYTETPLDRPSAPQLREAQALYQTANLKNER